MPKSAAVLFGIFLFCAPAAFSQSVPTFVGVRTFLGTPHVTNLDDLHADFAVLGVVEVNSMRDSSTRTGQTPPSH